MKSIPVRQITSAQRELNKAGRFSIRKLESILNGKDLQHELHRHDFFFVLFIQSGKGIHDIDFTPHPVTNKTVFFLRPGQVHQLQLKASAQGYLMEFDAEFYHPSDKLSAHRFRKVSNKSFCRFEADRFERLRFLMENIFEECLNKQEGYQDAIRANLELFFINCTRQSGNPGSHAAPGGDYVMDRFEEFTELLERNIATEKQVVYYAGEMNLSSYQLNDITKRAVGKTASALISEYILLEAKRNLLATPNQVKDIAWNLGYEDTSYFIRFFKKQTGLTPELYRHNFK